MDQQGRLINNLVKDMKPVNRDIQIRQIRHFYAAKPAYGEGVARGLGVVRKDVVQA